MEFWGKKEKKNPEMKLRKAFLIKKKDFDRNFAVFSDFIYAFFIFSFFN